ncbi:MAG: serine/threonine-protein kinase, partial [Propionivibrio sp.]
MGSLVNAIRTFQRGALSSVEFFAQVDQVLATDHGDSRHLLAILEEEHTNLPLPQDVYVAVHKRIEDMEQAKEKPVADETRALSEVKSQEIASAATIARPDAPPASGSEPIKGVGDTLNGRFVLEECLGFGGMGTVYKALDLRKQEASDRKPYIAIKVLNVQFRGHPKSLIALQREAKKAQALAHPNIVTVYDFDRDESVVYLTMELLTGRPLRQLLRAANFKGMPYAKALPIVTGIAKALAYAHERGFVHCDLKPANVFLTDSDEVKVIDFGISRVFRKPEEDVEATVFDAGSLGGLTPTYASAEMLEHRDPDPRDDIYALGCITYELLTGQHPFNRLPATQARSSKIKAQRPNNLGRRQWRALREALSFVRENRTPTVPQFLRGFSGERRAVEYVVMTVSVLAAVLLLIGALVYEWEFPRLRDDAPAAPATVASAPPPVTVAPPPVIVAPPPVAAAPPPVTVSPPQPSKPIRIASPASIASLLAGVPCSALAASAGDDGLLVQGYLPRNVSPDQLKEMLDTAGVSSLKLDVRQVKDDDCDILAVLAPYWRNNRQAGGATTIRTTGKN